jgi:tRNA A-37 threonylcarbamoyl transferase component Bud32
MSEWMPQHLAGEFVVERSTAGECAVRKSARRALAAAGFGLASDGAGRSASLVGRKPVAVLGSGDDECVLRRFTHGGLLRWLTGSRFADPRRPFVELELSQRLANSGVLTPEVVAARARRAPLWGWELALVTRRVRGAKDGGEVLEAHARGQLGRLELRGALAAAGRLVARLHALGFLHADLHPKNILVRAVDGACEAWLLDLDRSRFESELSDSDRDANLARLVRYVERRKARGQMALSRTDIARFLCAYEPERARRRARFHGAAEQYGRTLRWHRLGWLFQRE